MSFLTSKTMSSENTLGDVSSFWNRRGSEPFEDVSGRLIANLEEDIYHVPFLDDDDLHHSGPGNYRFKPFKNSFPICVELSLN